MGVQKDAGELMAWIYKIYEESKDGMIDIRPKTIIEETKWDVGRIARAINFISESGLIEMQSDDVMGFLMVTGVTPEGVKTVENSKKFKGAFSFTINLGAVAFSWQSK